MKMKVAAYCRLSEEDKNKSSVNDDSESIQNQKAMLMQYIYDHDWELYDIYSDDDYTGADRNRPAFNRMLEEAKNHKFDIILCKTQSRFTRELELVEKYIHGLFPIWGIRFVSIVDNADTANKGNKKSRQINGLVNEWYLEDMSENIKSVLINRRENGYHIGAFALYGYKKDPQKKGHLIIDEEPAKVVREVFSLFSQGYGKTAIARILNDKEIPNPTEYKRQQGLRYKQPTSRNSTLWKYFAISDMLANEIYIGNMVQGKYGSISYKTKQNKPRPKDLWYRVENTHQPIIDKQLWDKVQDLLKQRTKPFSIGKIGIFAKKVRCANCGYTMQSCKTKDRYYLKCSSKHVSKNSCIGSFIAVKALERIVLDELDRLSADYLDKDELSTQINLCNSFADQKENLEKEMSLYENRLEEYVKGIRELYLDKVKGQISIDDFNLLSKDFINSKERLEMQIVDCREKFEEIKVKQSAENNRRLIIEQYTNVDHLTREMVDTLIDYITVGKRDPETKELPVEIYWKF